MDMGAYKHRASVLLQTDGQVVIIAEAVADMATMNESFVAPVDIAIFVYGTAPATQ